MVSIANVLGKTFGQTLVVKVPTGYTSNRYQPEPVYDEFIVEKCLVSQYKTTDANIPELINENEVIRVSFPVDFTEELSNAQVVFNGSIYAVLGKPFRYNVTEAFSYNVIAYCQLVGDENE